LKDLFRKNALGICIGLVATAIAIDIWPPFHKGWDDSAADVITTEVQKAVDRKDSKDPKDLEDPQKRKDCMLESVRGHTFSFPKGPGTVTVGEDMGPFLANPEEGSIIYYLRITDNRNGLVLSDGDPPGFRSIYIPSSEGSKVCANRILAQQYGYGSY
jgi:hypothetical protein